MNYSCADCYDAMCRDLLKRCARDLDDTCLLQSHPPSLFDLFLKDLWNLKLLRDQYENERLALLDRLEKERIRIYELEV
jgi:hypothetical protein